MRLSFSLSITICIIESAGKVQTCRWQDSVDLVELGFLLMKYNATESETVDPTTKPQPNPKAQRLAAGKFHTGKFNVWSQDLF